MPRQPRNHRNGRPLSLVLVTFGLILLVAAVILPITVGLPIMAGELPSSTFSSCSQTGTISLQPASVQQGLSFTVQGSGFSPHGSSNPSDRSTYLIYMSTSIYSKGFTTWLPAFIADANGGFTYTKRLPAAIEVGSHDVYAMCYASVLNGGSGQWEQISNVATLTVTAPPPQGFTVTWIVQDAATYELLSGASAVLDNANTKSTGTDGKATFTGVSYGLHTIKVTKNEYNPKTANYQIVTNKELPIYLSKTMVVNPQITAVWSNLDIHVTGSGFYTSGLTGLYLDDKLRSEYVADSNGNIDFTYRYWPPAVTNHAVYVLDEASGTKSNIVTIGNPCQANEIWDPMVGCRLQCGANEEWNPALRMCLPIIECPGGCPTGQSCVSGQCVDICTHSHEHYDPAANLCVCDDFYSRDSGGYCVVTPSCPNGCPAGQRCSNSQCVDICTRANTHYDSILNTCVCNDGYQLDSSGSCIERVQECPLEGCPAGQVCKNGQCVPCSGAECCLLGSYWDDACQCCKSIVPCGIGGCPEGQTCVDNQCVPTNCPNSCPDGWSCIDGVCVETECSTECSQWQTCIDGQCIFDWSKIMPILRIFTGAVGALFIFAGAVAGSGISKPPGWRKR